MSRALSARGRGTAAPGAARMQANNLPPGLHMVHGMCGFVSKILGPYFTAHRLTSKGHPHELPEKLDKPFHVSKLGGRIFKIAPEDLEHPGYGRDTSGACGPNGHLAHTLNTIAAYNNGEERLAVLHVDGDGHCLVIFFFFFFFFFGWGWGEREEEKKKKKGEGGREKKRE